MHIVPRPGPIDLEQNVTTASHLIVASRIEPDESENEFKLLFEHFKNENRSCRTFWQKNNKFEGAQQESVVETV